MGRKNWHPFLAACALGIFSDAKRVFQNEKTIISTKDADGWTALHVGCLSGNVELVEWLLEVGADLDAVNHAGETALHVAARQGSLEVSYLLVKTALESSNQSSTNTSAGLVAARDKAGRTALHMACESGALFVTHLLLEGLDGRAQVPLVDPSWEDQNGENALNLAIQKRHAVIVEYLLEKFPHLECSASHQKEALRHHPELSRVHSALARRKAARRKTCRLLSTLARAGDVAGIDQLLREYPNKAELVNWDGSGGRTTLIEAAASGQVRVVQYLLDIEGVQPMVDHKCRKGLNAVQWAVKNGHREVVQVLIEKGQCNCFVVTKRGEDLPALARYFGHFELARILNRDHPKTPARPPRQESKSSSKSFHSNRSDGSNDPLVPAITRQVSSIVSVGDYSDCSIYEEDMLKRWLNELHLARYESVLKENGFDTLTLLTTVMEEDLDEMGFKKGHKRAFFTGQEGLQKLRAPDLERLIRSESNLGSVLQGGRGEPGDDAMEQLGLESKASPNDEAASSPGLSAISSLPNSPGLKKPNMGCSKSSLAGTFSKLCSLESTGEKEELKEIEISELELLEVIGEGSFGVVRKAQWRGMEVAVKELKVSASEVLGITGNEEDLRHEAKVLSRVCNHSCVIQLVGVIFSPSVAVITCYMPKGSVEDVLIKRQENINPKIIMRMAFEAAQGVLHLHREGVIHRDLAARNLLVDEHFHVRVSDFGFARVKDACASRGYTRTEMGPIKWTAPEAMRRKVYSESSDVFSFGVVLFEMIVKQPPWQGKENLDVAVRVCSGERMPIPPEIDPNVSTLIKKCWSEEPSRRPKLPQILQFLKSYSDFPTLDSAGNWKFLQLQNQKQLLSKNAAHTRSIPATLDSHHVYSAITFGEMPPPPALDLNLPEPQTTEVESQRPQRPTAKHQIAWDGQHLKNNFIASKSPHQADFPLLESTLSPLSLQNSRLQNRKSPSQPLHQRGRSSRNTKYKQRNNRSVENNSPNNISVERNHNNNQQSGQSTIIGNDVTSQKQSKRYHNNTKRGRRRGGRRGRGYSH